MKKKITFCLLILSLFTLSLVFPGKASAQVTKPWSGVCISNGDVATIQGFQCLVANFLQIAVSGIGFAGFVMIVIGAFSYLVSGGNAKGVDEARKTITFAVVGLVLALSSFFILNLISDFTGVKSLLKFTIPGSDVKTENL